MYDIKDTSTENSRASLKGTNIMVSSFEQRILDKIDRLDAYEKNEVRLGTLTPADRARAEREAVVEATQNAQAIGREIVAL